jgi:hypothetical protein
MNERSFFLSNARRTMPAAAAGALAVASILAARPARATPGFTGVPLKVTHTADWERVELHEDPNPIFAREPFVEASRRSAPEIRAAFDGDAEPPSSRFLLHAARGWDRADDPLPPVLLVHGAVVDATRSWGKGGFQGRAGDGLAAHLAARGRRVFAITFAHPHGDNWQESEQVANAIARVRKLTSAPKVDLVAHSKGGVAARLYCSNLRKPGMTAYRGDVRRLALLGCPNDGIDVAFAYPNLNFWIIANHASGPLSFTDALVYGTWTDLRRQALYAPPEGAGCFAGQAQMLKRWDTVYGLSHDPAQFDVETTYKGGRGQVSRSLGIDRAIQDGGDLMARLEKTGVDRRIELALLAGTKPNLLGFVGERRGPSDGLCLVRSALATDGLSRKGARVLRRDALYLSHLELVYAAPALRWIDEAIGN